MKRPFLVTAKIVLHGESPAAVKEQVAADIDMDAPGVTSVSLYAREVNESGPSPILALLPASSRKRASDPRTGNPSSLDTEEDLLNIDAVAFATLWSTVVTLQRQMGEANEQIASLRRQVKDAQFREAV